jgi:hypothetical protein
MATRHAVTATSVEALQKLIEHALTEETWEPGELHAIWHQLMGTPLEIELAGIPEAVAIDSQVRPKDLVTMNVPPLAILIAWKDWAKAASASRHRVLPAPILKGVYWLAIATAQVRHTTRITALGDVDCCAGFDWLVAQSWLDEDSRRVAGSTRAVLKAP